MMKGLKKETLLEAYRLTTDLLLYVQARTNLGMQTFDLINIIHLGLKFIATFYQPQTMEILPLCPGML